MHIYVLYVFPTLCHMQPPVDVFGQTTKLTWEAEGGVTNPGHLEGWGIGLVLNQDSYDTTEVGM